MGRRKLKLWLLRPVGYEPDREIPRSPWSPWYDKAFGFVVQAATEDDARRLAGENGGDEVGKKWLGKGKGDEVVYNPWADPSLSTCVELKPGTEPGVLMTDFASA